MSRKISELLGKLSAIEYIVILILCIAGSGLAIKLWLLDQDISYIGLRQDEVERLISWHLQKQLPLYAMVLAIAIGLIQILRTKTKARLYTLLLGWGLFFIQMVALLRVIQNVQFVMKLEMSLPSTTMEKHISSTVGWYQHLLFDKVGNFTPHGFWIIAVLIGVLASIWVSLLIDALRKGVRTSSVDDEEE